MAALYLLNEERREGALNLPVIMIDFLSPQIDLDLYDALLFSSKNGVRGIDRISPEWKKIPAYAIGEGTAAVIKELGGECHYQAKSAYGDHFAQEIKTTLLGKRVLFARAKVISSSLNTILQEAGVELEEAVVYQTLCHPCDTLKKPKEGAVIIFTSPSTIHCFFRCFVWESSYQAVVIGDKTALSMPKDIPYQIAPKQTISDCMTLAKKLSKNRL